MAKKKAKKRSTAKAIYAFRQTQDEYGDTDNTVFVGFGAKPSVSVSKETCEFGEEHEVKEVNTTGDFMFLSSDYDGLCATGFLKATGIRLEPGQVVKLSVKVVE